MRKATKADRPRIGTAETQCSICWEMFSSDTLCEMAKPYARHPDDTNTVGRIAVRDKCTPPEELGLFCRDRGDGVCVWSSEEDEAVKERMAKARQARKKK